MRLRIEDLAAAVDGTVIGSPGGDTSGMVDGASIDSRDLGPGALFVAIRAERDGHDFVAAAVAAGAGAALVDHRLDVDCAQIVVGDSVVGLGRAGALARSLVGGPIIGITGSVGKTSTKDLLASILERNGPFAASDRSLNNELGVPLTLLNAPIDAEAVVVEMGARGVGHIAALCAIATPTVGVVTTVAAAHIEMFGGLDQIAAAKGELIEALPATGTAVLNREVPAVSQMAGRCAGSIVWFGNGGDVVAEGIEIDGALRPRFRLCTPWGSAQVALEIGGRHNVANALAAAGAAGVAGIGIETIIAGLGSARLSPWRMELFVSSRGGTVINDAYNANPASMRAALMALTDLSADRRIAVVGLMAELGPDAVSEHRAIAAAAAESGIDLVVVGTDLYGVEAFPDVESAAAEMAPPTSGVAVLIKGSRVAGLERLADAWRP